jgi:hypothetical protein
MFDQEVSMALREPVPFDSVRSTREVFDEHLAFADRGEVEEDLARNYHQDCVILIGSGEYRGNAGARQLAARLSWEMPEAKFEYITRMVSGRFAFLEWTGTSRISSVTDGVDSFVIEHGKIVAQTIHYTVISKQK